MGVSRMEDKQRIEMLKENARIVDYEAGNIQCKAIEGVDHKDIMWAINKLYELDQENEELAISMNNLQKEITLIESRGN